MASEFEHRQHDRKTFKEEEPKLEYVMLAASMLVADGRDKEIAITQTFTLFDMIKRISEKRVELKCEMEARRRKG